MAEVLATHLCMTQFGQLSSTSKSRDKTIINLKKVQNGNLKLFICLSQLCIIIALCFKMNINT